MAFRRKHPFFNRDADLPAVEDSRISEPVKVTRCQCEHVNCHPRGNCQLPADGIEEHFGIKQALCHQCAGKTWL